MATFKNQFIEYFGKDIKLLFTEEFNFNFNEFLDGAFCEYEDDMEYEQELRRFKEVNETDSLIEYINDTGYFDLGALSYIGAYPLKKGEKIEINLFNKIKECICFEFGVIDLKLLREHKESIDEDFIEITKDHLCLDKYENRNLVKKIKATLNSKKLKDKSICHYDDFYSILSGLVNEENNE